MKYRSFSSARPPAGPEDTGGAGIDLRPEWADFIKWYGDSMDSLYTKCLKAARKYISKPIGLMSGGPKVGIRQGIALGNIGPMTRAIAKCGTGFFHDTDAQTLMSVKYSLAACRLHGLELRIEHVGLVPGVSDFQYLQYNTFINTLAVGLDMLHLSHSGLMYRKDHWYRGIYTRFTPVLKNYRTQPEMTKIAFLHSYITASVRPDSSNTDVVDVYDRTNKFWWANRPLPSFARLLGNP